MDMFCKCATVLAALIGVCFSGVQRLRAQECKLTEVGSVDIAAPDGGVLVPVKLDGVPKNLRLNINVPYSYLAPDVGNQLKLAQLDLPYPDADLLLGGEQLKDVHFHGKILAFSVPTLEVGSLVAHNVHMYNASESTTSGITGSIGLDFLGNYDVELDIAKNKLNLFDPHHCAGQVVYWTHQPVGIVDMQPMPGRLYHYNFGLDGKTINASITPSNPMTVLAFPIARENFGLTPSSPGVTPDSTYTGAGLYRFPFKALSADGLSITNPAVFLYGGENMKVCDGELHQTIRDTGYRCRGDAAMNVGLHELRALHLFFAFGEKKLYVTAANAN
jgi:hypothetical protein